MKKIYIAVLAAAAVCAMAVPPAAVRADAQTASFGPASDPMLLNPELREQADSKQVTVTSAPESALPVNIQFNKDENGFISSMMMTMDGYNKVGGISYRTYNTYGGYLWWNHDGMESTVVSPGNKMQAVQIVLTGYAEREYDVWYRVTSSGQGQMGWAKNGEVAGTVDLDEVILNLEVVILPKGSAAPEGNGSARYKSNRTGFLKVSDTDTTMVNADGSGYTGWLDEEHERYYFQDGHAVTGWQYIDGCKFYFEPNGQLRQDVDSLIGKQSSYLIKVNKALNCLTVYAKDGNKGYIIPVKAMRTSVGDDTPLGSFRTPAKYRWRFMIDDSYTQWATRITAGFLLHTVTYAKTDNMSLNVAGYNRLGVSRSHGCVRLTAENSKWIYDNCALGTTVMIYEDGQTPSPFMKPDQIPVSDQQTWDPTDPTVKLQ